MTFKDKVAVVTGGAQGIGKCIAECFRQEGATVHVIDIQQGPWFVGDLADKATLESFAGDVIAKSGKVDVLVNNAMPLFKGIDVCTYEEFAYAQAVGVVAPFYLAKLFKDHFAEGASIINISSSRDRMSQPQSESYTAAKGGIAALTHGRNRRAHARARRQPRGTRPRQLDLARMDRHVVQNLRRPGRLAALRGARRQPDGHCAHGPLPRLRQGGVHHGRKHLHRRRHDP